MLVMAMLAIGAALVVPSMSSFFKGRALDVESRRLLSLIHYARARAVSEGSPVVLWLDPSKSSYGQSLQPGFVDNDDRASSFSLEPGLSLETSRTDSLPVSENGDERYGLPEGLAVIRFTPDGYFDYSSIPQIVIRQSSDGALQIVQTADRLDYEIKTLTVGN